MTDIATIPADNYPVVYQNARTALIECAEIDECKDWIDKSAAMAMYAKQAQDDTLLKMAMRIKLRATRKAGELLNAVPSGTGKEGGHTSFLNKQETAAQNGISRDQAKQYIRVANVPVEKFEEQVESETPPTISKMADQGRMKRDLLKKMEAIKGFPMYWAGSLEVFLEHCDKEDPVTISTHLFDQKAEIKQKIEKAISYLTSIKDLL